MGDDRVRRPEVRAPEPLPGRSPAARGPRSWTRRLYHWVLSWGDHPQATWALFLLAFAESSFFPIPPDVLLIALCMGRPSRALVFATVCTAGSVLGGLFGYWIGSAVFDTVGREILEFYGLMDKYAEVQSLYRRYDVWAVGIAGLTPIPYKVFTVTAGLFKISLPGFIVASVLSRGLRFFVVALVLKRWGEPAREFLDRHLNLLTIAFVALLIGGFVLLRFAF